MKLAEVSKGKTNNLNLIRLVAAYMVIFGHSFSLTGSGLDYIKRLSGEKTSFGDLAVSTFFFLGGFLILKSAENKGAFKPFIAARCKRIFPQLWIVVIVSAFVVGPIFSRLSVSEYFTDLNTYKYLLNGLFILIHDLPGVFIDNKYNSTVNGVLWTLPVEFVCYFACYVYYLLKKKIKPVYTVPLVTLVYIAVVVLNNHMLITIIRPVMFFYVGMIFYSYKEYIVVDIRLFILSLILFLLGFFFIGYSIISVVCLSYIIMYIGFGIKQIFDFSFFGLDITYGIYLTGFLIQQSLCALFTDISQIWNFIISVVIATVMGILLALADEKMKGMIYG